MASGKFWRRRRLPTSAALLLLAVAIPEASAQSQGDPENGLARLESFLADVHTLTATFEQELWSAEHRLQQTDKGTLALARPNRFRWTYLDPTELIVVADGNKLWTYDVELAEVTVAPFDGETVGASPAFLLSGDRNVRDGFELVQSYTADGLDWIHLAPRAAGSDFTSVRIGFDGNAPRRIELVDGLNNVTRISLDDLVVNPPLPDATFELAVPEGVEVSGGQG